MTFSWRPMSAPSSAVCSPKKSQKIIRVGCCKKKTELPKIALFGSSAVLLEQRPVSLRPPLTKGSALSRQAQLIQNLNKFREGFSETWGREGGEFMSDGAGVWDVWHSAFEDSLRIFVDHLRGFFLAQNSFGSFQSI